MNITYSDIPAEQTSELMDAVIKNVIESEYLEKIEFNSVFLFYFNEVIDQFICLYESTGRDAGLMVNALLLWMALRR